MYRCSVVSLLLFLLAISFDLASAENKVCVIMSARKQEECGRMKMRGREEGERKKKLKEGQSGDGPILIHFRNFEKKPERCGTHKQGSNGKKTK